MPVYVDTLLCEAIRPEANNKVSLLGLFGNAILVPQIPTQLANLAIIQRWEPAPQDQEGRRFTFAIEIRGPGLAPIRLQEQQLTVGPGPRPQISVAVQIQGFPILQEGDFQIATYIDGMERHVHTFFIGIPTNELRDALRLVGFT